ncbi:MAG TPA: pyridoxamine 5'-phosphate oxidase family protein [Patescibacteria group bacterium]|nr:pyridoxamine 5'-phosphate oxidase family protein [Patescibacteria group bacterium]
MATPPARHELEIMPELECVRLLRSNTLGRIALVDGENRPLIFPVNYFFDEGIVVFRTDPGTKLDLAPGAPVAFEIDGYEPAESIGWSVVVKGLSHDLSEPSDDRARRIHFWPVNPLVAGAKAHWIGIWANEVTGRLFRPVPGVVS